MLLANLKDKIEDIYSKETEYLVEWICNHFEVDRLKQLDTSQIIRAIKIMEKVRELEIRRVEDDPVKRTVTILHGEVEED